MELPCTHLLFLASFTILTTHVSAVVRFIAPGIEGRSSQVMPCDVRDFIGWLLPNRQVIHNSNQVDGSKYELHSSKSLRIHKLSKEDLGRYDCLFRNISGSVEPAVSYMLPYVVTKRNYLKSFGIAIGATLVFILLAALIAVVVEKHSRVKAKAQAAANQVEPLPPAIVSYKPSSPGTVIPLGGMNGPWQGSEHNYGGSHHNYVGGSDHNYGGSDYNYGGSEQKYGGSTIQLGGNPQSHHHSKASLDRSTDVGSVNISVGSSRGSRDTRI